MTILLFVFKCFGGMASGVTFHFERKIFMLRFCTCVLPRPSAGAAAAISGTGDPTTCSCLWHQTDKHMAALPCARHCCLHCCCCCCCCTTEQNVKIKTNRNYTTKKRTNERTNESRMLFKPNHSSSSSSSNSGTESSVAAKGLSHSKVSWDR